MASTYTYPGVYIEEIPSGVRPIAGVSTSNTAFVDFFDRGPVNRAMRVDNLGDLDRIFGGLHPASEASYGLQQFFLNGGATAFVVRVLLEREQGDQDDDGTAFDPIGSATVTLPATTGGDSVTFTATSPGSWGNKLQVGIIHPDPANNLAFSVTVREYAGELLVAAENFDNVNTIAGDPSNIEAVINDVSTLVTVAVETADTRPASAAADAAAQVTALENQRPAAEASVAGAEANLAARVAELGPLQVAADQAVTDFVAAAVAAERTANQNAAAASAVKIKEVVDADPTVAAAQAAFDTATTDYEAARDAWLAPAGPADPVAVTAHVDATQAVLDARAQVPAAPPQTLDVDLAQNEVTVVVAEAVATFPDTPVDAAIGTAVAALRTAVDDLALQIAAARPRAELNAEVMTLRQAEAVTASALAAAEATARVAAATDPAVVAARDAATNKQAEVSSAEDGVLVAKDALAALDQQIRVAARAADIDELDDLGPSVLVALVDGSDGVRPGSGVWRQKASNAIVGDLADSSGIFALNEIAPQIFNIMCLPAAASLDEAGTSACYASALAYCDDKRAFLLVDPPEDKNDRLELPNWADLPRHENAAVFFPRLTIGDPLAGNAPREVASSGTMAGILARTDADRGFFKAPAGTATSLRGTSLRLTHELTDKQNGVLNTQGINVLRNFPIYNNISWGSRTLVGADAMASEWKYIPVRRTALFIEESLFQGLKWVVFEPNDEPLWAQLRLNVGAFMHGLFRRGAFQGTKPSDAYLVKCDSETTTQNDINAGVVNVLVGFAPLKPAEFVVIKIKQLAGQVQA